MALAAPQAVPPTEDAAPRVPNGPVVAAGGLLFAAGGAALWLAQDGRIAGLYVIGMALGAVLYHTTFGFAASWRQLLQNGRSLGLRAQMVMLAVATTVFFPLLAAGEAFGQPLGGALAPVGVSVLFGAFLFGMGMQLAGACASGTLYTIGGGSTRMVITLVFFMVGSVLGSLHLPWWLAQPSLGVVSLPQSLGLLPALAGQLGVFALAFFCFVWIEKSRHGRVESLFRVTASGQGARWIHGPWPLLAGALGLALLNICTLLVAGHPWTVNFGYTLWGAKLAQAGGLDVAAWPFWQWPFPRQALEGSVFANTTSVMNFGIMAGALLAAGLAGRFHPLWRLPFLSLLAAVLGGLLMGYGARLAFGCNIGAYFSGIASGSLHGWLWFAAALLGSYAGFKFRPIFGLK